MLRDLRGLFAEGRTAKLFSGRRRTSPASSKTSETSKTPSGMAISTWPRDTWFAGQAEICNVNLQGKPSMCCVNVLKCAV